MQIHKAYRHQKPPIKRQPDRTCLEYNRNADYPKRT